MPPSNRSPRLLFGPLTSNEEPAGRGGRGCGSAGTARGARGRRRRGHLTAAGCPTGEGAPYSAPQLFRAPRLPNRYRLVNNSCARTASAGAGIPHLRPPLPSRRRPSCSARAGGRGRHLCSWNPERERLGADLRPGSVGGEGVSRRRAAGLVTRKRTQRAARLWAGWTSDDPPRS